MIPEWSVKEPTEKQMNLIKCMQEFGCPLFEGKTRGEACVYIDRNMNQYKLNTMSDCALERGYI